MRVVLLGPQRRPVVESVVRSLGLTGPFATVTMCGIPPMVRFIPPPVFSDDSGTDSSFHSST